MTHPEPEKGRRKQAMQQLREERKERVAAATAMMKGQKQAIKAIKEILKGVGQTVPQLAEKTGMGTSEVFWTVMALKKYGEVAEGEKEGSYFLYRLAEGTAAETERSPEEDER